MIWWMGGAGVSNKAKVYIMAGQSNMSGQASTSGLDSQYVGALNAYIYSTYGSGTNTRTALTQTWQRLELNKNNNNDGVNGVSQQNVMGPELVFGKKMSDLAQDRIFILKYSIIGTDLTVSGGTNNWKPISNTLYKTLATDTVLNGLAAIVSNFGLTPEVKGFIWMQGEADADAAGTTQTEYNRQSNILIKQLADDIDNAGYDCSGMRVTWGRIHNNFSPARVRQTEVRAAQVDTATNFNSQNIGYTRLVKSTNYIDSDSYGLNVDLVHWNQAGQISFGTDLYTYYSQYINEVTTPTYASTSGYDTDAAAYVTAAKLISQTHADAVNAFVVYCKANSLWTKFAAVWLRGRNRKANKLNLLNPVDSDAAFRLSFGLPVYHSDSGYQNQTNVTAGYVDTFLPFNSLGQNTMGAFFNSKTNSQDTLYSFGVTNNGNTSRLTWHIRFSDDKSYPADACGEQTGAAGTDSTGTHIITRTASNNFNTFIRSTKASFGITSAAPDANTVIILGRNVNGTKTGGNLRVMGTFGLLNGSLSDSDAANLRTAVDTYEAAF